MKDFLLTGGIDDDPRLECDLIGPGYELDSKVRIKLEPKAEMKKRGMDSPDDADGLALTFAVPASNRPIGTPSDTRRRNALDLPGPRSFLCEVFYDTYSRHFACACRSKDRSCR